MAPPTAERAPISPWPIAGLVGLACVAFMIAAGSVALGMPWWALLGLALVWLAALLVSVAWFVRRPRSVVLLPVAVALVWLGTAVAGARWLGWAPG